jgi:hypothetical protein
MKHEIADADVEDLKALLEKVFPDLAGEVHQLIEEMDKFSFIYTSQEKFHALMTLGMKTFGNVMYYP